MTREITKITNKTMSKIIKCPCCDSVLKYERYKNTHIWVCSGDTCAIVMFEYECKLNTLDLISRLEGQFDANDKRQK